MKAIKDLKIPDEQKNKISYILFNAIFTMDFAKEVKKNRALLETFYEEMFFDNKELDLLLNLENFLLVKNKEVDLEKYTSTIVKFFYDEDLLDEETLIDWDDNKLDSKISIDFRYNKEVDEKFKKFSRTILDWLK